MNNKEVAQKVVDRIVEMIESGKTLPWVKPWGKQNTVTVVDGIKTVTLYPTAWNRKGSLYRGANTYLPVGEYITFNQCRAEGGTVNKGARAWPVVYWNFTEKEVENPDTHEMEKRKIPILRYYQVFRIEDTTLEQKHSPEPRVIQIPVTHEEPVDNTIALDESAEAVISDYVSRAGNGFHINRDKVSNRAFYSPSADYVTVPMAEQFSSVAEFYSTLFHELGHSTGHKTRLNRFTGKAACASFGSVEYSREELVAEATAAGLLNALGMEDANAFRNSAAYIKSWASHIKEDPLMYVSAAQKAQDAINLILGVQDET